MKQATGCPFMKLKNKNKTIFDKSIYTQNILVIFYLFNFIGKTVSYFIVYCIFYFPSKHTKLDNKHINFKRI